MDEEVKLPLTAYYKHRKLINRIGGTLFWAFMGVVGAAIVGAAALAWELSQGPVNAARAIPVIEKVMSRQERMRVKIGSLTLTQQGRGNPLALQMNNVHLLGPRGEFLTINRIDMGLSPWRLLLAQARFKYAKIESLSVRIIRLPDGTITLTGVDTDKKEAAESVALKLDNLVNDLPSVDKLTLSGTRVIFEDQKDALIRRFDDVNMEVTQDNGFGGRSVTGFLTMTLTGIQDGSQATFDFIYDAADKTLTANASLHDASTRKLIGSILRAANLPMIDMLVQGRAEIRLKNDFSLDFLSLRLKGDDGTLHWPRNYGTGLEDQKLTKFDIDVGFDPETQTLALQNATLTLKGITLTTTGTLAAVGGWNKLKGHLTAKIPVIAVDVLPAVWPAVWDSGGRHWLVDRMDKGRFTNIDVNVPFTANRKMLEQQPGDTEPEYTWDIATGNIKGTFGYTGVTVDYREPMFPSKGTTGTGIYEGLSLTLDIDKADIGQLNVTKGRMYFDDLITAGTGHAELNLTMNGPISAVFDYLDREPISYRRKVDIDGTKAKGTADVDLKVSFPTTKDMKVEDVHVAAQAKLHDLSMPAAVKGLLLAGPAFDLEASENHFKISGTGFIEGQPATVSWHELFSPKPTDEFASKLDADIKTDKNIRGHFIGSIEQHIEGTIPAKIAMLTTPDGKSKLTVAATLDAAKIDLSNPFNAVKDTGVPATLNMTATLQKGFIQSIDTLAVKGTGFNIASGNIAFARDKNNDPILSKALLNGVRMGATDAIIDATWQNENNIKAKVTGASFDARYIMGNTKKPDASKKPDAQPTKPTVETPLAYDITLKTNQLYVSDLPLKNVTASFIGNADGTIKTASLDGQAGTGPVTLQYDNARLLWDGTDAGATLAAFGVTDRVRGGKLHIEGKPIAKGQPGDMKGTMLIEQFAVVKAPMLAKLVNMLSVPGLLNILSADTGLHFDRAEGNMALLNRPGGMTIQFADGRTSGASLGLTFEGSVNTATDTMALQGTAIPLSQLNSIVSKIPLVGDILTGGAAGSGIFAATYTMSGPSADPSVSVNPLSVLTPGILRRILFEGSLGKTEAKP